LPLIEFMSAGVPAVSPRHTAMIDYITDENSFVVDHSWSWVPWPNDPRLRFRCVNYPIIWESLVDAFVSSYETAARNHELYKRMSDSANETMKLICSKLIVWEKLISFLDALA